MMLKSAYTNPFLSLLAEPMAILKKGAKAKPFSSLFLSLMLSCFLNACASYSLDEERSQQLSLQTGLEGSGLIADNAPILRIYDASQNFNKVGTVRAKASGGVWVDPQIASFYADKMDFTVGEHRYKNLVYRVHFSEIPFSIFPFHLASGKNVGLIFIITLNENDEPILFTTTHTCGCYKAILPTTYTPESFYPEGFSSDELPVYGETLAPLISLSETSSRICIAIRPNQHRVMDVSACHGSNFKTANLLPLNHLVALPTENGSVSLYHEEGIMEGYVKGSVKMWESLLLSWPSLDFFVGTDKAFPSLEGSSNTFYTSLKPWQRERSDMSNFPEFLSYWGWKLDGKLD